MVFVYRGMKVDEGLPKLGASASTLGIRKGKDIEVDDDGNVHRPDFQRGSKNGMSCSPSIASLPDFAIPVEWGGRNARVKVWRIRAEELGPALTAEQDGVSTSPSVRRIQ